MKYHIKVEYTTGDSFGTYETTETLDYGWENIDVVEKNAKAIVAHYRAYSDENNYYRRETPDRGYKEEWWYKKPSDSWNEHVDDGMYLTLDNGDKILYRCPWCGYFEHFIGAEIETEKLKFYAN